MFRPDGEPLLPNWRHLPVGYHGRAGTVVVSGTDVVRPSGQRKAPHGRLPDLRPVPAPRHRGRARLRGRRAVRARRAGARPRTSPSTSSASSALNDWSARDIQAWEYVPLGPVPRQVVRDLDQRVGHPAGGPRGRLDRPARPGPRRRCDYLRVDGPAGLDIDVEVVLNGEVVSPSAVRLDVLVAGPDAGPPDRQRRLACAPATCSPPARSAAPERGPARLAARAAAGAARSRSRRGGRERTFLEDGDEVTLRYSAPGTGGGRISLGEVTGRILPAR